MNAFQMLTVWLVDFQILSALLLAIALALRCFLRQPAERLVVAWGTWLGVLALALAAAMPAGPRLSIDSLPGYTFERPALETIEVAATELIEIDTVQEPDLPTAEPMLAATLPVPQEAFAEEASSERPSVLAVLVGIWFAAMMLCCGWLALGFVQSRRLVFFARLAPAWIQVELRRIVGPRRRIAGVLASERVQSAVALSAVRPRIILPEGTAESSDAKLVRAALAHEWAHIRHGDLWLLALERTLIPLLALNPLFWWLRRGVRADQELLADAAAASDSPVEYAEALLALARNAQPRPAVLAGLSMWENRNNESTLSGRIAMILDPKWPLASTSRRTIVALVAGILLASVGCLSLGTLRPLIAQESAIKPAPMVLAVETPTSNAGNVTSLAEVTQIELGLVVLSIDRPKLEAATVTLDEAIDRITEGRSRREAGLIIADVTPKEVESLLAGLRETKSVTTLSEPRLITLDGQEARIQIGGEQPLLRIEETINGKHEERIQYQTVGTSVLLVPRVAAGESPQTLTIEIVAEQSAMIPSEKLSVKLADPNIQQGERLASLVTHKFTVKEDIKIGKSLLVAESSEREGEKGKDQFLMVISPKEPVRTLVAVQAQPTPQPIDDVLANPRDPMTQPPALPPITPAPAEPAQKDQQNLEAAIQALMQERDARQKETEQLKQRVEALTRRVEELHGSPRRGPAGRRLTYSYPLRNRKAADVAGELQEALKESLPGLVVRVDERTNTIYVEGEEQAFGEELQKILDARDQPGAQNNPLKPATSQPSNELPSAPQGRNQRIRSLPRKPSGEEVLHVYPVRNHMASDLAEAVQKNLGHMLSELKVQVDERTNSLIISVDKNHAEGLQEILTAWDRDGFGKPMQPPAQAQSVPQNAAQFRARLRLLELDVAEAELELQKAKQAYERAEKLKGTAAISETEVAVHQFEVEKAQIQLERARVRLEEATEQQPATQQQPKLGR